MVWNIFMLLYFCKSRDLGALLSDNVIFLIFSSYKSFPPLFIFWGGEEKEELASAIVL